MLESCPYCRNQVLFTSDICPNCKRQRPPIGDAPLKNEKPRSTQDRQVDGRPLTVSFKCSSCNASLRIPLPGFQSVFRCPSCKSEFLIQKSSETPAVYLITPNMQHSGPPIGASNAQRKKIPNEVRTALQLFGLSEETNFKEAQAAYRKLMKSYHPDLVSHLGRDLQELAERKTKEVNSAFEILKAFFLKT